MTAIDPVAATVADAHQVAAGRPTRALPAAHLLNLSVYWLGINVIWSGLGYVIFQARFNAMFGETAGPSYVAFLEVIPLAVAIIVQPTVAAISDYSVTRWGRRKPYILIGGLLDVVFLAGIAASNEFVAIAAFALLLQFSSNFAQGPFQGYVPDLVPERQVGVASGLMGLMIIGGQVTGVGIATLGLLDKNPYLLGTPEAGAFAQAHFFLPTVGLAVIEIVTMVPILLFVHEGRQAPSRDGRSWVQIALGTWGLDVLRERSYVWLLVSRLFFLMSASMVTFAGIYFLERSLGLSQDETARPLIIIAGVLGITTGIVTFPAARLSDRVGRKRMIYVAIGVGVLGVLGVSAAPSFPLMLAALVLVGVSSGTFLAVDWALMTDIIPKATSGRYMGLSNVATALSGPVSRTTGGVLLTVLVLAGLPAGAPPDAPATVSSLYAAGPRIAIGLTVLFFAISAWALHHVDEHRRND
jgi:MFS family permease